MKKQLFLGLGLLMFGLYSCGDSSSEESMVKEEVKEEKEVWNSLSFNDGGYLCQIELPAEDKSGGASKVYFDENTGELHILAGKRIDLIIVEDESQMNMKKNEIADHPFYASEFTMENDSSLIYRMYASDGSKEEWHCYAERNSSYGKWLIRSNENKSFSEYDVKLMMSVIDRLSIQ